MSRPRRPIVTSANWAIAGAVLLMLLAPLLVEVPPVLDYPNHLARAWLLAHAADDPWLSRIYAPHWRIIPNLATDLTLPPVLRVLPLHVSGRLALAATLLLPLVGVALYSRALFGRLFHWPFASALVAYNLAFLLGLLNFLLGVAVAFAVAALWVAGRARRPRLTVAAAAAGAVCVFFCHLIALTLLAALIGGHEIERNAGGSAPSAMRLLRRALAVGPVFVPAALLYIASPTAGATGLALWLPILSKPLFGIAPFINYDYAFDFATAAGVLAFVVLALRRRWLLLPRSTGIVLLALLAAYLALPFRVKGGAFFDIRFAVLAGYVLFAGIRERQPLSGRALAIAVCCLLGLLGARMGRLAVVWQAQAGDVAELRRVIAPVPPGSRVLVANVTPEDAAQYWDGAPAVRRIGGMLMADVHLPALLVPERQAMIQTLFADPTQQPIAVRPDYAQSAAPSADWGPPSYALLATGLRTPQDQTHYPYLADWPSHFDYVLVMNAGGMPDPAHYLPDRLDLLRVSDIAALFRVRR